MVDLDSNKLTPARVDAELPLLPEPEGTILKNHLKQVKLSVVISHQFILLLQIAQFYYESKTKDCHHEWTFSNRIDFQTKFSMFYFNLTTKIELICGKC